MNTEIISTKQGIFIMSMFTIGSTIIISSDAKTKQDVWITILIALVMSLPMLFIYSKILMLYPGKDLFDILKEVFGNVAGKIIALLFVWYCFHLGALVIRNFSDFVTIISFPETPQSLIIIFIGLFTIYMVKSGIEVLGRWTFFVFPIIMAIIIVTICLSMTKANFNNLRPLLYDGIKPVLLGSFTFLSFPFLEVVVFTILLSSLKESKKTFKVFLISSLISSLVMITISVRNILVLSSSLAIDYYFPSYIAVRLIKIGDFIERFEIVVAIVFIFGGFVKISVCLLAASRGVANILNIKNYRYVVAPVAFLMMDLAEIIYENTMEMFKWLSEIYKYYAIPFQIILPIIILIAAKIKIKVTSKKQKSEVSSQ